MKALEAAREHVVNSRREEQAHALAEAFEPPRRRLALGRRVELAEALSTG